MKSLSLAALALVLATPIASAWLIGDLTNEEARRLAAEGVELDYAIRPASLGPVADRYVGVLACAVAVGALGVLLWATRSRRLDPRWWNVLAPLVAAGVLAGFSWRLMTAGGIGANIGAGLVVVIGGPLLVALLAGAVVAAVLIRRRRAPRASGTPG
ncbi:MAG TPA: hypothetical protein VNV66_20950 [Pilimelia sp.]|nr:hypothetical protein [Pilimelia sp.]